MAETYSTLLVDPPWGYANFGQAKHGAARAHYAGTAVEAIGTVPVGDWARPSATLLLWATLPKLDEAIDVMRAWGFALVTALPWVKTHPPSAELAKGIGFWWHSTTELLLVCRRGKARAPRYRKHEKPDGLLVGEPCVFYSRRGPHSRKPLPLIEWIEAYLPGPYLELYARTTRPGWTSYGHAIGHHLDARGVTPLEDL